jgi:DNA-binding NtrC family response regulator
VQLLKYPTIENSSTGSEFEDRVQQLTQLARALASEIETLQRELSADLVLDRRIDFDNDGIDFYDEVERYEIELIKSALAKSGGNQSRAARLLQLKSTTLNAKIKLYGLNPERSITMPRPQ